MPKFFCAIGWHNEGRVQRTSDKRDKRITWTIEAETAVLAVGFIRDWVLARPIPKGRQRRITFTNASLVAEEDWAGVENRMRAARTQDRRE